MTMRLFRLVLPLTATFVVALAWPLTAVRGQMPVRPPVYAITNAKIVPVSGAVIDKGTLVMRDGVIENVGASVAAPPEAMIVDGTNLTVYPGLIDLANSAVITGDAAAGAAAAAARGGGGGGGRAGGGNANITWADQERENRVAQLHPDADAVALVQYDGDGPRRLAAAGITAVVAVPAQGIIRGQSALVNVAQPPDPSAVSAVGSYRRGLSVVRPGVAQHVAMSSGRGGNAFPGALLGVIAFTRQAFYDAAWQKDARAYASRHPEATLPGFEPLLDALAPALDRKMPVAFEATEEREIVRMLNLAKEFNLDPIIVGGLEATSTIEDLKAAKARVIYSANFPAADAAGGRRGGGPGGGGQDTAIRIIHQRQNAPKVPAALDKAGIAFGFTTAGMQNPADFVRNVARMVKEGGLSEDAALKALTTGAAKIAGAADRVGTLEKGKLANVIVTEGGLFDNGRIRHVFVGGWPIDIDLPAAPAAQGRGGRGGQ